jgi:hypothetical protein
MDSKCSYDIWFSGPAKEINFVFDADAHPKAVHFQMPPLHHMNVFHLKKSRFHKLLDARRS